MLLCESKEQQHLQVVYFDQTLDTTCAEVTKMYDKKTIEEMKFKSE